MPVWFACNAALRSSSQMARPRAAAQQSADQNKRLARTLPEGDGRTKREARMQTRRCRRRANTKEQTAATRSRATTRAGSSCRPRASGRGQRSSRPQIRLSFRCRHSSQNQVKVCVMEAQPPRCQHPHCPLHRRRQLLIGMYQLRHRCHRGHLHPNHCSPHCRPDLRRK